MSDDEEVRICRVCGAEMIEINGEWVCPCGCGTQYGSEKQAPHKAALPCRQLFADGGVTTC